MTNELSFVHLIVTPNAVKEYIDNNSLLKMALTMVGYYDEVLNFCEQARPLFIENLKILNTTELGLNFLNKLNALGLDTREILFRTNNNEIEQSKT